MKNIDNAFRKVSNYLGFSSPLDSFAGNMRPLETLEEERAGATPLAELLPFSYYDNDSGIAFNKNDSLGFWYEISPLVGSSAHIEKNLTLFFNDELPEDVYLQFLIIASHNIEDVLDLWLSGRNYGGEANERLTKFRQEFIKESSREFGKANDGILARNYRSFVCCSMKDDNKNHGIEKLLSFKRKLENKLHAEKLAPRLMKAEDLISICREILRMKLGQEHGEKFSYDILNDMSKQICYDLEPLKVLADKVTHEKSGLVSKLFYPSNLPESYSLSEMVHLLGRSDKAIPARFIISVSIAANVGAKGTARLVNQGHRSLHASEKDYTRHDLNAKSVAAQWREVLAVHKSGERFLSESIAVMITAPKEEIEIAEETLKSLWNAQDWRLTWAYQTQLLLMLSILPMTQAGLWPGLSWFGYTRYALSGEIVAKLPLQGEWKGVPSSGALLMGRCGQLFNYNPFYRIDGGGNYNGILMAPPGSGKSFFLQELAQSMIAQDVAVFILDIGASYQNICRRFGGQMIRFNQDNRMSLNPFASLISSGGVYAKATQLMSQGLKDEDIIAETGLSAEKLEALRIGKSSVSSGEKEQSAMALLTK